MWQKVLLTPNFDESLKKLLSCVSLLHVLLEDVAGHFNVSATALWFAQSPEFAPELLVFFQGVILVTHPFCSRILGKLLVSLSWQMLVKKHSNCFPLTAPKARPVNAPIRETFASPSNLRGLGRRSLVTAGRRRRGG